MTIDYDIDKEDMVNSVTLLLTPAEYLVISSALKKYVEDESNHEHDREIARSMRIVIEDNKGY